MDPVKKNTSKSGSLNCFCWATQWIVLCAIVATLAVMYSNLKQEMETLRLHPSQERVKRQQPGAPGAPGVPGPSQGAPGHPGQYGQPGQRGYGGQPGYQWTWRTQVGPQGPQGPPGARGAPGAKGDTGAAGAMGQPGAQGNDGQPGAPGSPGEPGFAGAPGPPSAAGQPGAQGAPGQPGSAGQPGQPGQPGLPAPPATKPGSSFIAWGYLQCPGGSTSTFPASTMPLYRGFMARPNTVSDDGATILCLGTTTDTRGSAAQAPAAPASTSVIAPIRLGRSDRVQPCHVCYRADAKFHVMVPGQTICPPSMNRAPEYIGWLATAGGSSSDHICVNRATDLSSTTGLKPVQFSSCPSRGAACNNYSNNQRVPCAVCVK